MAPAPCGRGARAGAAAVPRFWAQPGAALPRGLGRACAIRGSPAGPPLATWRPPTRRPRHARHRHAAADPLLVSRDADGDARGRAQAVPPARPRPGAVGGWGRRAIGHGRPLLPPHREAVQGLLQRRPARLRLSRLGIRAGWVRAAHSAAPARTAGPDAHGHAGLSRRITLWLSVGGARRTAVRPAGVRRGSAGLPAHRRILRTLDLRRSAADGEQLRQRAFLLRPSRVLRRPGPPGTGEARDRGTRRTAS